MDGTNNTAGPVIERHHMNIHVSPVEFLTTACYVIIFGFMWRSLSARWSENAYGQAMAFIF